MARTNPYGLKVDLDTEAGEVAVTLRKREGEGFTEVLAGVRAGDVVVTEGSFVVKSEFAKASLQEEE